MAGPKRNRQPFWIRRAERSLLLFAGFFEAWQVQPGKWQTTFCLITTAANRLLEPIHNRMPVILDEAGAADWMNWREPDHPRSNACWCPPLPIFWWCDRSLRW
jgi:putative SOS response-associated peptidase YedK